jgi:hypothetical protein
MRKEVGTMRAVPCYGYRPHAVYQIHDFLAMSLHHRAEHAAALGSGGFRFNASACARSEAANSIEICN